MKEVLISAEKTLDYQSVGMYGRELLITLAQAVFDKAKHPSTDGTDIEAADSKRMLDAYIHYCMHMPRIPAGRSKQSFTAGWRRVSAVRVLRRMASWLPK